MDQLSSSKSTFKINGQLTFHCVMKDLTDCKTDISKTENGILMEGSIKVLVSDFKLKFQKL